MSNNSLKEAQATTARIVANVEKVMVGQQETVLMAVMTLLCRGHMLIEGVPGVGKTMFARSLARSIGGSFRRIQCTADLLPSDITGTYIFDQRDRDFHFRPGPLIANIVLVDEINRTSPKTQSAFLECMEELQVTVEGVTHPMPEPFLLLATRNPTEHGGTFPLPETELDRFLTRVRLDYPTSEEEADIIERQLPIHPIRSLEQVVSREEVLQAQEAVREIYVDRLVADYVVAMVGATRNHPSLSLGASPRASLALTNLAQAHALLEDRDFVMPDDVKAVAKAALGHRVILTAGSRSSTTEDHIVDQVLESVPVERRRGPERSPSAASGPREG